MKTGNAGRVGLSMDSARAAPHPNLGLVQSRELTLQRFFPSSLRALGRARRDARPAGAKRTRGFSFGEWARASCRLLRRPPIPAGACVLVPLRCSRTQVRSAPVLTENFGRDRA